MSQFGGSTFGGYTGRWLLGKVVGDERLYTIQVTLEIPGQPPKQLAPWAAMVPLSAVPKVRVGWRVPVRVAADNHQLLMFEWEKL